MKDERGIEIVVQSFKKKLLNTILLVEASLVDLETYDMNKIYSPKELEPYDALSDRFIRAVEISLKFFRAYEKQVEVINSDTIRDLLNKMEKLELISSTCIWLEMRDIRNRIVHDYLPEQNSPSS